MKSRHLGYVIPLGVYARTVRDIEHKKTFYWKISTKHKIRHHSLR